MSVCKTLFKHGKSSFEYYKLKTKKRKLTLLDGPVLFIVEMLSSWTDS